MSIKFGCEFVQNKNVTLEKNGESKKSNYWQHTLAHTDSIYIFYKCVKECDTQVQ